MKCPKCKSNWQFFDENAWIEKDEPVICGFCATTVRETLEHRLAETFCNLGLPMTADALKEIADKSCSALGISDKEQSEER